MLAIFVCGAKIHSMEEEKGLDYFAANQKTIGAALLKMNPYDAEEKRDEYLNKLSGVTNRADKPVVQKLSICLRAIELNYPDTF